jgi:uncharacterized SAM-binding protein YcdF (DUF218 family)
LRAVPSALLWNANPAEISAVNDTFVRLGIESWKSAISSLLLPPTPFLLMVLIGGIVMCRRRFVGWTLLLTGSLGIWLMCTVAAGTVITHMLVMPPRPLSLAEVHDLRATQKAAIVVIGGGRDPLALEYGMPDLSTFGVERLRYGLWLSRATALPLAFTGGTAHAGLPGASEAEIAARIAQLEFGQQIRWIETQSRDTNENALLTLPMLKEQGIEHILLVTHGFHMPRVLRAFERASQRTSISMKVTPAAIRLRDESHPIKAVDWLPSRGGFAMVNLALHEWLGRIGGA